MSSRSVAALLAANLLLIPGLSGCSRNSESPRAEKKMEVIAQPDCPDLARQLAEAQAELTKLSAENATLERKVEGYKAEQQAEEEAEEEINYDLPIKQILSLQKTFFQAMMPEVKLDPVLLKPQKDSNDEPVYNSTGQVTIEYKGGKPVLARLVLAAGDDVANDDGEKQAYNIDIYLTDDNGKLKLFVNDVTVNFEGKGAEAIATLPNYKRGYTYTDLKGDPLMSPLAVLVPYLTDHARRAEIPGAGDYMKGASTAAVAAGGSAKQKPATAKP